MNLENTQQVIAKVKNKNVNLIAVSKYQSDSDIKTLIKLGVSDFAENTEQNLKKRIELFPNVNWHFIGRIQSNKIKSIVNKSILIHSVSSLEHLAKIDKAALAINKIQNILIQINLTNESTKSGINLTELESFLKQAQAFPNINCQGFMIIGDHTDDQSIISATFKHANSLFNHYHEQYNLSILSMGMSNDFELAIKYGSTHVRIGSKLFE